MMAALIIELEADVFGSHTFVAAGQPVAKVTVSGTPAGPMGQGVECFPAGIFELDASLDVYRALQGVLCWPARVRFRADLKPINASGGYVVHLLEVTAVLDQPLRRDE